MSAILGITGTTCVGKSKVTVEVAKLLGSEVISADSMQIYKGMDIGTAKITTAEMQGIKHNMLDIVYPNEHFSSFTYQEMAGKLIDSVANVPIVSGGTGFYFDALLYPPQFNEVSVEIREKLQEELKENGLKYLQEELKRIDLDSYCKIDINNPVRVTRALEIALSGESLSQGNNHENPPKRKMVLFVLQRSRCDLYNAINSRVDIMFKQGLVTECEELLKKYGRLNTSAFQAIGYKEVFDYLEEKCSLKEAIDCVKINTRHYAKRQISYFKRMNVYEYIDVDEFADETAIAKHIVEQYNSAKDST